MPLDPSELIAGGGALFGIPSISPNFKSYPPRYGRRSQPARGVTAPVGGTGGAGNIQDDETAQGGTGEPGLSPDDQRVKDLALNPPQPAKGVRGVLGTIAQVGGSILGAPNIADLGSQLRNPGLGAWQNNLRNAQIVSNLSDKADVRATNKASRQEMSAARNDAREQTALNNYERQRAAIETKGASDIPALPPSSQLQSPEMFRPGQDNLANVGLPESRTLTSPDFSGAGGQGPSIGRQTVPGATVESQIDPDTGKPFSQTGSVERVPRPAALGGGTDVMVRPNAQTLQARALQKKKDELQAAADIKPPAKADIHEMYASAVADALGRGVKPTDDPKVQQLADAIIAAQKPAADKEPARDDKAITIYAKDPSTRTPEEAAYLKGYEKYVDKTKTQPGVTRMEVLAGNKLDVQSRAATFKAWQPAMDSAERFNVMTKNYEDAVRNNDQQAMLSLLANHLGMTMGLQKGSRITKDIINEAERSRPWLQGIASKFDKDGYLTGVTLTPMQMGQMVHLGAERFNQDVQKSANEAEYYQGAPDAGPRRTPNESTMRFYLSQVGGDVAKAKAMAAKDGWSEK